MDRPTRSLKLPRPKKIQTQRKYGDLFILFCVTCDLLYRYRKLVYALFGVNLLKLVKYCQFIIIIIIVRL